MTRVRLTRIYTHHTHEYIRGIGTVILTNIRKQYPSPGDDASTAEAGSDRVGRDEQGEARRANTTPNGGPHLELGRLRLITWSKSDFSIAEATRPTYLHVYLYKDVKAYPSHTVRSVLRVPVPGKHTMEKTNLKNEIE